MSTSTGSISLSGLLGGTAGQIDVPSLISSLMAAAQVPQQQLQDQLTTQQNFMAAYQTINTKLTALQTAAHNLASPVTWVTRTATSSSPSVVATTTGFPMEGQTTFTVKSTAVAQITTMTADATSGKVFADGSSLTISGANGPKTITPASGSASEVASAINNAGVGVKASVVHADSGDVLQITSNSTGTANAFTASSSDASGSTAQTIVSPQDAVLTVGDPAAGGYTITSATNTFSNAIGGVTFTVSQPGVTATIGVSLSAQGIADQVKALVDAANTAGAELQNDTQQGSPLQGTHDLNALITSIGDSVSHGTTAGGTLKDWGIDLDKNGVLSFDEDAFLTAYANKPSDAKAAIQGFAQSLESTADSAVDVGHGSVTLKMQEITAQETRLNDSISAWSDRLDQMQSNMQAKFLAMETALATLQSQQTYLTNMFKSATSSNSSSSS